MASAVVATAAVVLSVAVYFASWTGERTEDKIRLAQGDPGGTWSNPIHLTPIPAGGSRRIPPDYLLRMARGVRSFGIQCTDPLGFAYATKTSDHGSIVCRGTHVPESVTRGAPYLEEADTATDRCRYPVVRPTSD